MIDNLIRRFDEKIKEAEKKLRIKLDNKSDLDDPAHHLDASMLIMALNSGNFFEVYYQDEIFAEAFTSMQAQYGQEMTECFAYVYSYPDYCARVKLHKGITTFFYEQYLEDIELYKNTQLSVAHHHFFKLAKFLHDRAAAYRQMGSLDLRVEKSLDDIRTNLIVDILLKSSGVNHAIYIIESKLAHPKIEEYCKKTHDFLKIFRSFFSKFYDPQFDNYHREEVMANIESKSYEMIPREDRSFVTRLLIVMKGAYCKKVYEHQKKLAVIIFTAHSLPEALEKIREASKTNFYEPNHEAIALGLINGRFKSSFIQLFQEKNVPVKTERLAYLFKTINALSDIDHASLQFLKILLQTGQEMSAQANNNTSNDSGSLIRKLCRLMI